MEPRVACQPFPDGFCIVGGVVVEDQMESLVLPGRVALVEMLEELQELLPLGIDRVLLDNMDLETLKEAVRMIQGMGPKRPLSEASGNMNLDRVGPVAQTGVDFISVGALTHSAPGADLSLRILDRWMGPKGS